MIQIIVVCLSTLIIMINKYEFCIIAPIITSWRSESSNISLVILDKILYYSRNLSFWKIRLPRLRDQYKPRTVRPVPLPRTMPLNLPRPGSSARSSVLCKVLYQQTSQFCKGARGRPRGQKHTITRGSQLPPRRIHLLSVIAYHLQRDH